MIAIKEEAELYKTKNIFFKQVVFKLGGGTLSIGQNNVFHTKVYVLSEGGDIRIGNLNVFEEKVIIYNKSKTAPLEIGDCNYMNAGTRIYSTRIGSLNDFGINSYVENSRLGNGNIVGVEAKVKPSTELIDRKAISTMGTIHDNVIFNEERKKNEMLVIIKNTNACFKKANSIKKQQQAARNK